MFISIILFKIIGKKFEQIGFAEYTVSKRFIGFIQPLLVIGMGVSLPKFIALEITQESKREIQYVAQILLTIIFLLTLTISLLFGKYISKLVFGSYNNSLLIISCLTYFFSLMIHTCVYNYFRGSGNYQLSSLLQFVNLALFPFGTYFIANGIEAYYFWLAIFTFFFALIIQLKLIGIVQLPVGKIKPIIVRFLSYGSKRVVGDVVFAMFSSVPAFITANLFSLKDA